MSVSLPGNKSSAATRRLQIGSSPFRLPLHLLAPGVGDELVPEFIKGLGSRFLEDLGVVPAVPAGAVERLDDFLIVGFLDPREEPGGRTVTIGIFGSVSVKTTDRRAGLVVNSLRVVRFGADSLNPPGCPISRVSKHTKQKFWRKILTRFSPIRSDPISPM